MDVAADYSIDLFCIHIWHFGLWHSNKKVDIIIHLLWIWLYFILSWTTTSSIAFYNARPRLQRCCRSCGNNRRWRLIFAMLAAGNNRSRRRKYNGTIVFLKIMPTPFAAPVPVSRLSMIPFPAWTGATNWVKPIVKVYYQLNLPAWNVHCDSFQTELHLEGLTLMYFFQLYLRWFA